MMRLKLWQWVILGLPLATVVGFLLIAAGWQIHGWGMNWIWGLVVLVFVGWRWLLVKWTRPAVEEMATVMTIVSEELEGNESLDLPLDRDLAKRLEFEIQTVLSVARKDGAIWEDWSTFWQRCQEMVSAIAHVYYPNVNYPLLSIYIPQAYGLIRGTVDDMDRWMQQLAPVLNQVTVAQAVQAYEVYRKLEPSARKLLKVLDWAQWVINPAVAVAKRTSLRFSNEANQQLLGNLNQLLREAALRNLARQAIALYGEGEVPLPDIPSTATETGLPQTKTQTLQEILSQAQPEAMVQQQPINLLLVGRTGAGKSSLINTLFQAERATVDVLPSTDQIQNYHWQVETEESLQLWDTPGYEQVARADLRQMVLDYATNADLLLLVTPALDPALQMDLDFFQEITADINALPTLAIVTQVDRLRPIREWNPPYDWQQGDRPKEQAIRAATQYRAEILAPYCEQVLPLVTGDQSTRVAWGDEALSLALLEVIAPAKQLRLARFLRNREARVIAAAKIIDHYTLQMTTTQGLTELLKSPVLQFISTFSTGSPALAYVLAEKIPVEQLPVVIGKLQMAYDLYGLIDLEDADSNARHFDLLALWPFLIEGTDSPQQHAWALGHALMEYWTQNLSLQQLKERFDFYLTNNE